MKRKMLKAARVIARHSRALSRTKHAFKKGAITGVRIGAHMGKRVVVRAGKRLLAASPGAVEVFVKQKVLGEAPREQHFILKDGRTLTSVYDLIHHLDLMDDKLFKSHVGLLKNDFSRWLHDAFDEKSLASDIRHVYDRMEAQRLIMRKILGDIKKHVKK